MHSHPGLQPQPSNEVGSVPECREQADQSFPASEESAVSASTSFNDLPGSSVQTIRGSSGEYWSRLLTTAALCLWPPIRMVVALLGLSPRTWLNWVRQECLGNNPASFGVRTVLTLITALALLYLSLSKIIR